MALPLSQLPSEVVREVKAHRWFSFFMFALVSAVILLVAFFYPYKYKSEVVVFVDNSGMTSSLMEGAATTAEIGDVASSARELISTFEVLEPLARNERLFGPGAAQADEDTTRARVEMLRSNIIVSRLGKNYLSIGYTDEDPRQAFFTAQSVGQAFIEEISDLRREESRSAFAFIDNQVNSYESELEAAEERLKQFLSENSEGTESEAENKIASVRGRIELAKLDLEGLQSRRQSLENQLSGVGQNISREVTQDRITQRIISLQSQLDTLRLQYHDTYPDIISLEGQIAELQRRREAGDTGRPIYDSPQTASANPLYQELKAELVKVTADARQIETRIGSLEDLLDRELDRMRKIQANKAQLADLTRNMEVNRSIYNDLLRRRESARLSVNLNLQAQGVTYEIQEGARYPTAPEGLRFEQFASVGLLLGLLAPFGLIAGLLQVDPRVRSKQILETDYGIPVLGEIPQVSTPYEKRRRKGSYWLLGFAVLVVVAIYIAIVGLQFMGVIG